MLNAIGAGYSFTGMGFFDSGFLFNRDGSFTLGSYDDPATGQGVMVALEGAPTRTAWAQKTMQRYKQWKREQETTKP